MSRSREGGREGGGRAAGGCRGPSWGVPPRRGAPRPAAAPARRDPSEGPGEPVRGVSEERREKGKHPDTTQPLRRAWPPAGNFTGSSAEFREAPVHPPGAGSWHGVGGQMPCSASAPCQEYVFVHKGCNRGCLLHQTFEPLPAKALACSGACFTERVCSGGLWRAPAEKGDDIIVCKSNAFLGFKHTSSEEFYGGQMP